MLHPWIVLGSQALIKFTYTSSLVAQRLKHLPAMRETWVRSLAREDSPGEGNGNPLQYSCLENPMDRGAWWATVHGVAKSRTQLSEGFPGGSDGKESACNAGDLGLIPGLGRSPLAY